MVPTTSLGSRSGVNWMRSNWTPGPSEDLTSSVLASPGMPSSSTWPLERRATSVARSRHPGYDGLGDSVRSFWDQVGPLGMEGLMWSIRWPPAPFHPDRSACRATRGTSGGGNDCRRGLTRKTQKSFVGKHRQGPPTAQDNTFACRASMPIVSRHELAKRNPRMLAAAKLRPRTWTSAHPRVWAGAEDQQGLLDRVAAPPPTGLEVRCQRERSQWATASWPGDSAQFTALARAGVAAARQEREAERRRTRQKSRPEGADDRVQEAPRAQQSERGRVDW